MSENTGTIRKYQDIPGGRFIAGNPGKPQGTKHMTTRIMEAIVSVSDGSGDADDVLIVRKLISQAKNGDMQAMKLIFNYVDGMPEQRNPEKQQIGRAHV